MGVVDLESGRLEGGPPPEEVFWEVWVKAGWTARFRGVQISKSAAEEGAYLIEPLHPAGDPAEWRLARFAAGKAVRLLVPESVRITNRAGAIAEIERRPNGPSDLGWHG